MEARSGSDRGPSSLDREDILGLVLCGGRSRRMGRDKAQLVLGGKRLIERAVEVLRPLTREVLLAPGDSPRFGGLGLRQVPEPDPGRGPLGGLDAALQAGLLEAEPPAWWLVVACDLPWLSPRSLEPLLQAAAADPTVDIVLFEREGRPEPLAALYSQRCAQAVRAALEGERGRMIDCWDAGEAPLKVRQLTLDPAQAPQLTNLNTPEDWERAVHRDSNPFDGGGGA